MEEFMNKNNINPDDKLPEGEALQPEAPAAPVQPEAPAVPVQPEAPAAPVQPTVPAAPVQFEAPAAPVQFEAPAAPVQPTAPAAPVQPTAPAAPVQPEAPAVPVQPEAPAAPVQPEAPAVPVQPEAPAAPVQFEAPAAPVQPTAPAAPVQPEAPVNQPPVFSGSVQGSYTQPQGNYQYGNTSYGGQPYPTPTPEQAEKLRKSNKKGRKAFVIVLAIIIAITAVAIPVSLINRDNKPAVSDSDVPTINPDAPSIEINETPAADEAADSKGVLTAEQVYEKISASNVAVVVYKSGAIYTEGTGIITMEDSKNKCTYILTCAHVVSDAGIEIAIQLENGDRYDAELVGYDARTDIGVLRIRETGFTVAEFGDSDALKVGSTVYAIGNPGGSALFGTFTDGKVSAIGRNITSSIGYDMVCIQHNAAISPGNSGGALVNEYGQVVGINSSKIAATEFEGISFSIPITQAKEVIDKVISHGYVPGRAKLGISYVANDSSAINAVYAMAVQMMDLPSGSLVIYSIDDDSALSGTEAQPGDMIIAVNGKDLDTADVLLETIEDSSVGDTIELTLFRIEKSGGKYETEEFKVKATLIEEKNTAKEETTTHGVYGNDDNFGFGFGF